MSALIPSAQEIIGWAEDFSRGQAREPRQLSLLAIAFGGFRQQYDESDPHLCFYLPALVSASIKPGDPTTLPVAAIATMICLGVDIFDDVADADLPAHWSGYSASEINLVAATLFSALPMRALGTLDLPPARLALMQQAMAEGLLAMAAGQHGDVAQRGTNTPAPAAIEAALAGKSGGEAEMFARLAATAAGAPDDAIEAYGEMGMAFGSAGQLSSDCFDLFQAKWSRDLANGTRTFPLAAHLSRLDEAGREAFLALLAEAERDPAAQTRVRAELRAAGALRHCALVIEVQVQRAKRALDRADPLTPAREELRSRIEQASLFPRAQA